VAAGAVLVPAGLAAWLASAPGRAWACRQIEAAGAPDHGTLHIGGLTWSGAGLRLRDVHLRAPDGREVVAIGDATVRIGVDARWPLRVHVAELHLSGVRLDTRAGPDGAVELAGMWVPSDAPSTPWDGLGFDLVIDRIALDAESLAWSDGATRVALQDVHLVGAVETAGRTVRIPHATLRASHLEPDIGTLRLELAGQWDGTRAEATEFALDLGAQRLVGRARVDNLEGTPTLDATLERTRFVPGALPWPTPIRGALDISGHVRGTLEAPNAALTVRGPAGTVSATGRWRADDASWALELDTPGLRLDTLLEDGPAAGLVATLRLAGRGTSWPGTLHADGRVMARVVLDDPAGPLAIEAASPVGLANGALTLDSLVLRVPGIEARGRVRADLEASSARATLESATVELGAIAARAGLDPLVRGRAGVKGTVVDVRWDGPTTARAAGTLVGSGLALPGRGAVSRVEGPFSAAWGPDGSRVEATVAAEGVLAGSEARVASAEAVLDLRVDEAGTPAGTVGLKVGDTRLGPLHATRGALSLTLDGSRVTLDAGLDGPDGPVLSAAGSADTARGRADLTSLQVALPGAPDPWRTEDPARVRWSDRGLEEVHLAMVAGPSRVALDGHWTDTGPVDLRVAAREVRVSTLTALAPEALAGVYGALTLDAGIEGTAAQPELAATASVTHARLPGTLDDADLRLSLAGRRGDVRIDAVATHAGTVLAELDGHVPLDLAGGTPRLRADGPLALQLRVPEGDATPWNAALAGTPLPEMHGSAALDIAGTPASPTTRLVASALVPTGVGDPAWIDVDASTDGDRVRVRALARERMRRLVSVEGTARTSLPVVARSLLDGTATPDLGSPDTWLSQLDLSILPLDVPAERLAELLERPGAMRGRILGGFRLSGAATAPQLEGALMLVEGKLGRLNVSPAQLTLTPDLGGYRLAVELGFPGTRRKGRKPAAGGRLALRGFVPRDPLGPSLSREGLDLTVEGRKVPLAGFDALLPDVDGLTGVLDLDGRVTGSLEAPVPSATLTLAGAAGTLLATGVRYDDVHASLGIEKDTVMVRALRAQTRPVEGGLTQETGTLRAEGRLQLVDGEPGAARGTLHLDRAWLSARPDAALRVRRGTLRVDGTWPTVTVSGDAELEDARLMLDESFFASASRALELDPAVRVLRPRPATAVEAGPGLPTTLPEGVDAAPMPTVAPPMLPPALGLAIDLDLARSGLLEARMPMEDSLGGAVAGLTTIQVSTQVDGTLKVGADHGELVLTGQILPLRGTARVFGRPFDIQGGTVAFTGRDSTNPILDLTGVYATTGHGTITVRITGSADSPKLAFSSDAYPSTDDILSLLLTGVPASQIGAGGQGADALSMLVSGLASGLAAGGAGGTVDLFELSTEGVRIGQRIGPDLFLVVEGNLLADDTNTSRLVLSLSWQLTDRWNAELSSGSAGTTRASVRWKRSY
jgi:autotransporter translocation and assembly factor TamB